jgi:hypothetical protein
MTRQPHASRACLQLETLEDRTTPSTLGLSGVGAFANMGSVDAVLITGPPPVRAAPISVLQRLDNIGDQAEGKGPPPIRAALVSLLQRLDNIEIQVPPNPIRVSPVVFGVSDLPTSDGTLATTLPSDVA